jgi:hypothetical protein
MDLGHTLDPRVLVPAEIVKGEERAVCTAFARARPIHNSSPYPIDRLAWRPVRRPGFTQRSSNRIAARPASKERIFESPAKPVPAIGRQFRMREANAQGELAGWDRPETSPPQQTVERQRVPVPLGFDDTMPIELLHAAIQVDESQMLVDGHPSGASRKDQRRTPVVGRDAGRKTQGHRPNGGE